MLRSSNSQVDLMGFTLKGWSKGIDFELEIRRLIERGVQVRVLIIDHLHPHLDGFIRDDQLNPERRRRIRAELEESLLYFAGIQERLMQLVKPPQKGKFRVRAVRAGKMNCSLCRIDDDVIVIPYLTSVGTAQSPLLAIHGTSSELFRLFESEFEELWSLNEPMPEASSPSP